MENMPNTTKNAVVKKPELKCYFSVRVSEQDKGKKQNGLICFALPEIGVLFKTRIVGSFFELEYISLLSLLRFIELNQKAFENLKLSILCSSPLLVYQMNENSGCQSEIRPLRSLVLAFKRKLNFTLSWIPEGENRALNGMMDLPPLNISFDFNFEDIQNKTKGK